MKKLYTDPELEVLSLRLMIDVLGPSTEEDNIPGGGTDQDDDWDDDWIDLD